LKSARSAPRTGALIASQTEEGFRVYAVRNPSKVYLVKKEGDQWTCTCPDFEFHKGDTTWRCKHVLAVAPWPKPEETLPVEVEFDDPTKGMSLPEAPAPDQIRRKRVQKEAGPGDGQASAIPAAAGGESPPRVQEKTLVQEKSGPPKPGTPKRARRVANGSAQMLIKRSVSPDGRIDSVSVEFSMPVSDIPNGEIKDKALKTLQLQKEIVGAFLKLNGQKAPANAAPTPAPLPQGNQGNGDGKPVFARMIDIGKVNGKWGERLCINVQVGDRRCRLFGSPDQLALHIARAGYHMNPEDIEDGRRLNVACLVVMKPSDDGRYLNIARVVSLPKKGGNDGRASN